MVGQRPDEGDVRGAERGLAVAERPDRPEDLVAGHERRGDHRADADVLDHAVGRRRVVEGGVREVVAGQDDLARGHGLAEHARPDRQPDRADPVAAALAPDAGIVGEAQVPGRRVHEVDHRPVGLEEPGGLGDAPRSAGRGSRRAPPSGSWRPMAVGRGRRGLGGDGVRRGAAAVGRGSSRAPGLIVATTRGYAALREHGHRRSPMASTSSGRCPARREWSRRRAERRPRTSCPPPTVRGRPPP